MPVINFIDQNRKVVCVPGANLREVAQRERVSVYKGIHQLLNCHGNGLCGSCQMAVIDGRGMPRNDTEQKRLKGVAEPWRLACQYEVLDNITVTTDEAKVAAYQKASAENAAATTAAKQAKQAEAPADDVPTDDAPVAEEAVTA
jgi:ferredoxin